MLKEAVRILEQAPDETFRVNVNVSPRTLGDFKFLDLLDRLVTSSPIDPGRLTIEITETAIIVDVAGVQDALRHIKGLGCRVALDDFGSGFTSFLHLKQLPVDDIKIDGSFVTGLCESANDQHLVRAMVEMARGMSMGTTAEFVESQDALSLLGSFGVDTAQGYINGLPAPVDSLIAARKVPQSQSSE
jgi:EAL domain-containing protein (putative c-di-GMP-specific phosphodiesterase class I)